jgi:hypothetical protein
MGIRTYLREVQEGDLPRLSDPEHIFKLFRWDDPAVLNLEKSWDGLHRLLTAVGSQAELGFLRSGGTEVGAQLSYGRPRLLSRDFVRRLNAALKAITDEQFWAAFDAKVFKADDVYPGIWDEPPDELREEYVFYLHKLRNLVERVAAAGGQVALVVL